MRKCQNFLVFLAVAALMAFVSPLAPGASVVGDAEWVVAVEGADVFSVGDVFMVRCTVDILAAGTLSGFETNAGFNHNSPVAASDHGIGVYAVGVFAGPFGACPIG